MLAEGALDKELAGLSAVTVAEADACGILLLWLFHLLSLHGAMGPFSMWGRLTPSQHQRRGELCMTHPPLHMWLWTQMYKDIHTRTQGFKVPGKACGYKCIL